MLAVVGFAANDSGVAIPAMMVGVLMPWITAFVAMPSPPNEAPPQSVDVEAPVATGSS